MTAERPNHLFCWIGDADLAAWAASIGKPAEAMLASLGRKLKPAEGTGPIKTLADSVPFDAIHLLSDKPGQIGDAFARWIGPQTQVHQVKLTTPVDYSEIFTGVDGVLKEVVGALKGEYALSIHLSPGTPAMTAVWVLLGKSRYPATFYQTYKSEVIPTNIPFDLLVDFLPTVLHASDRILQSSNLAEAGTGSFGAVIGSSPAIREVIARARRIALRDVSVLLLGESGVGKDVFATAIHGASRRSGRPFVAINCAAVPKELLESELFGHKKGSFTGATNDRQGAFELADSGTLFLDEVGECDLTMQAKLLRVLQPNHDDPPATRRFRRIGDSADLTADVRVVAATNRDLHAEVAAGRFREDLYYRLAAFTVKIPPLRNRQADIPVIAEHLLERINLDFAKAEPGYQHKSLSVRTKKFLREQPWPGNVRQLQNALLQAAVMVDGPTIDPAAIQQGLAESTHPSASHPFDPPIGDGFSLVTHLESIQKRFLARAMSEAEGKKNLAASLLGYTSYQTLDAQLKRLDVQWNEA